MFQGAAAENALKIYAYAMKRMRGEQVTISKAGSKTGNKATSASEYLASLGEEFDLSDFATEMPEWFLEAAYERLAETFSKPYWLEVNDTTRNQIQSLVKQGIDDGLSTREIAKLIGQASPERAGPRAMAVSRTEVGNAVSSGAVISIKQTGIETGLEMGKQWLSIHGTTTRPEHSEADGQTVPVDDTFTVGGEQARWPGDENLSAGNRISCQCSVVSDFVGDELDPLDEDDLRDEQLPPVKQYGDKATEIISMGLDGTIL